MDINATFIGQIIVFLIMLWFIAKVVVPMIATPISERHKKIADGLAAAERGQKDLVAAESRVDAIVREARVRAQQIEAQAQGFQQLEVTIGIGCVRPGVCGPILRALRFPVPRQGPQQAVLPRVHRSCRPWGLRGAAPERATARWPAGKAPQDAGGRPLRQELQRPRRRPPVGARTLPRRGSAGMAAIPETGNARHGRCGAEPSSCP